MRKSTAQTSSPCDLSLRNLGSGKFFCMENDADCCRRPRATRRVRRADGSPKRGRTANRRRAPCCGCIRMTAPQTAPRAAPPACAPSAPRRRPPGERGLPTSDDPSWQNPGRARPNQHPRTSPAPRPPRPPLAARPAPAPPRRARQIRSSPPSLAATAADGGSSQSCAGSRGRRAQGDGQRLVVGVLDVPALHRAAQRVRVDPNAIKLTARTVFAIRQP